MSTGHTVGSQIEKIRQDLPSSVRLIAVTKYVSEIQMQEAYEAGIRDFGESRVQDAQVKMKALQHLPGITWHFIGHLQGNKAKLALQLFDWIHAVDSLKLAQRLNRIAFEQKTSAQLCLQVKIRPDPQKFGWEPSTLLQDLMALRSLPDLNIRGLMVILPQGLTDPEISQAFEETAQLANRIYHHPETPLSVSELSMGMSQDYRLAVSAGATMIRLGRILFPSLKG